MRNKVQLPKDPPLKAGGTGAVRRSGLATKKGIGAAAAAKNNAGKTKTKKGPAGGGLEFNVPSKIDVSYRKNKSVNAEIPPTQIPSKFHIVDKSVTPVNDPNLVTTYDDKDNMWSTTVFPSLRPSGRTEVLHLDKWLHDQLEVMAKRNLEPIESVKEAQKLYSITFHEILRQVYVHCSERGILMEKVWSRYLQLFDHILRLREKERGEYNSKLQHQKLMYQQLYKDKDEKFNQVFLGLAAEKERVQMSKDKLERSVLMLQEEFKKRMKRESRMKQVIKQLRSSLAIQNNVIDVNQSGYDSEEETLLPEDLGVESFSDTNIVLVQKLNFIQNKVSQIQKGMHDLDSGYGSLSQIDNLVTTIGETISRLNIEDSTKTGTDSSAANSRPESRVSSSRRSGMSRFMFDKQVQTSQDDEISAIPNSLQAYFSQSLYFHDSTLKTREFVIVCIGSIYTQQMLINEEIETKKIRRIDLPEFVYSYFLSLFGVRQVAESHLLSFMVTADSLRSTSLRIDTFCKFMDMPSSPSATSTSSASRGSSRAGHNDTSNAANTKNTEKAPEKQFSGKKETPCFPVYSSEDYRFYLYALSQLYEGINSERVFVEHDDFSQTISLDTASEIIEEVFGGASFGDHESQSNIHVVKACQSYLLDDGRLDLDQFLDILVREFHSRTAKYDSQLRALYNAAVATKEISANKDEIVFDDFLNLFQAFNMNLCEQEVLQMYREVLQDTDSAISNSGMMRKESEEGALIESIMKVAYKHNLLAWKTILPVCVDRKLVTLALFRFLNNAWDNDKTEFKLYVQSIEDQEIRKTLIQIDSRMNDFEVILDDEENGALAISTFRAIQEKIYFSKLETSYKSPLHG